MTTETVLSKDDKRRILDDNVLPYEPQIVAVMNAVEQAVLQSKEINQLRIEAAAGFSSVGHLCTLLDTQTAILNDAMAVMKALRESAKPVDESKGNFDARIPARIYRRFVDDHARLLHEIANCPPAVKQEQVVMEFAEKVGATEKQI